MEAEISQAQASSAIAAQNSHIGTINVPPTGAAPQPYEATWARVIIRQKTQVAMCRWSLGFGLFNAVMLAFLLAYVMGLGAQVEHVTWLTADHVQTATKNWRAMDDKMEQRIKGIIALCK